MGFLAMVGIVLLGGALVYALAIAARALVTAVAGIPGRLPPFGEAPLGSSSRCSIVTRVALALAGPLAVYLAIVTAWTFTLRHTRVIDGTMTPTIVEVIPSGPAAAAGVRDGDRIVAVDGRPLARFSDLRDAVAARAGEGVELSLVRDGAPLRLRVTPGPAGSRFAGKLALHQIPTLPTWSVALRQALEMPFRVIEAQIRQAMNPRVTELSGPIGITREVSAAARPSSAFVLATGVAQAGTTTLAAFVMVALFLFPFRPRRPASPAAAEAAPPALRPWVRLAARTVDDALLTLIVCLIFAAIDPALVELALASTLLLAVPLEAALLASWGYTPGKWLLRVVVRDSLGEKLGFGQALRRAAAVNVFGLALNQPIGLVTGPLAFRRLRRSGATYWDALDGSRVDHGAVGGGRAALAILIVVAFFAFQALIVIRATATDLLLR
jgi:hypothetical protein